MRRREFLLGIGGTVLGTKVAAAQAQQAAAPVIGVLTLASLPDWAAKGIHAGLKEAGYVENVSLTMITRSAEGHFDRLPALTSDLVQNRIAVIFAMFSPVPTRAAM